MDSTASRLSRACRDVGGVAVRCRKGEVNAFLLIPVLQPIKRPQWCPSAMLGGRPIDGAIQGKQAVPTQDAACPRSPTALWRKAIVQVARDEKYCGPGLFESSWADRSRRAPQI